MGIIFWLLVLVCVPLGLAYRRTDLKSASVILGLVLLLYTWSVDGAVLFKAILWVLFAGLVSLNFVEFRREVVSKQLLTAFRRMLPTISKTEPPLHV